MFGMRLCANLSGLMFVVSPTIWRGGGGGGGKCVWVVVRLGYVGMEMG